MKTRRRQRKPRLPRTDWFKAVRLLAGKCDHEAEAMRQTTRQDDQKGEGKG